jgi:hypothetical protein
MGGLGNQLFQYAAARKLSVLHRTPVRLDVSWFEKHEDCQYSLGPFNIEEVFATKEEIAGLRTRGELSRVIWRLGQRILPQFGSMTFRENHLRPFDPNILKTSRDVYLDGYWQSEKYFQGIEDIIRREFTIRFEMDKQNKEMAEQITRTESVSIHVRRGDYVTNPQVSRAFGICGVDYYARCVELVALKVAKPHLFVFSDDPGWVAENMPLGFETTFVTHNGRNRSYEDLRLMSLCNHNIIANSSFSWWGAWLNRNPDKVILAPSRWFRKAAFDTRDVLPRDWLKV